ncbi:hypothetical protein HAX54_013163, partial [Datura stramonium]|nr:hypothetical protein [Datura stramonium]
FNHYSRILALVKEKPLVLKYHKGALLKGKVTINLIWYGKFTPAQRSIIVDFIQSLSTKSKKITAPPSVASWWRRTPKGGAVITLGLLRPIPSQIVLTASGCSGRGLLHEPVLWHARVDSRERVAVRRTKQRDVGVDGMVINLATILAGTVTNPFDGGYFQGPANAPLEAVSACTGIFGSGAFPGYPGEVLLDIKTGASYNAPGVNGRKYLLPAMWDPKTSKCKTLV